MVRLQAHGNTTNIFTSCVCYSVATRKNISICADQEEWIQENYLNLSRFVQDKLDEHIEEHS